MPRPRAHVWISAPRTDACRAELIWPWRTSEPRTEAQLHWASSHNITLHLFTAGFSNLGYLRLFFQLTGHGQLILRCRKTLHQSITLLPPICRQTVIWNITFHFIDKGTETSKWKNTWSALNSTVQKFYTTVLNQEQTCRRWREYKSHISLGLQSCMHKNKRPPNSVCLTVKRSLASCKPFQNTTSSCQNSLGANLHKDSGWLSAARTNFLFWGCSAAQHKQTTVKLYKTEKVLSFIDLKIENKRTKNLLWVFNNLLTCDTDQITGKGLHLQTELSAEARWSSLKAFSVFSSTTFRAQTCRLQLTLILPQNRAQL